MKIVDCRLRNEPTHHDQGAGHSDSRPPTILYVITDLKLGGVPLHLFRLACDIRSRGLEPTVVSLSPPEPVSDMLSQEGIPVRDCGGCCGWDIRVIGRLTQVVREVRPNLIHSFLFHANFAARRAARKAGFPKEKLICEIQTVEVERSWHLWVDRWTHRGCRCVVGNSPSVVDHLHVQARIPRDRLRLIRGGIDPTAYENAEAVDRPSLGLPMDARIVLWVGRLDPVKGLDVLIDAFGGVARRSSAHLLLVGDGAMRGELERQIARAGLTGRVQLLGMRRDVPALLKAADAFVFPSRTEGWPNALLEAMASARPIVTTDVPGCRDLIEHERTGLLVPYCDTRALADAIERLLQDREAAAGWGAAAREEVTRRWHFRTMMDGYESLYREILTATGSSAN